MTILDANILLYAHNPAAPQNARVTDWLKKLLLEEELIGLPWVSVWAFLRVWTNPRLWPVPNTVGDAFAILRYWFTQPGVVLISPGPRHAELLERVTTQHQVAGPTATDAVLAAIALEIGAALASTDQDFSRFSGLRWVNPLAPS